MSLSINGIMNFTVVVLTYFFIVSRLSLIT